MLRLLHKHLNSPNASASIITPILHLGWRRQRGLGISQDPGHTHPFHLASLACPSSLSLSVFNTQCTGEPQDTGMVHSHQLLVVIMQVVCHFESYMTNIKVISDMKSRLRVDVTEWHTTIKTGLLFL